MGAVYAHMDAVHGGIDGQGPIPGEDEDEGEELEDGVREELEAAMMREVPRVGQLEEGNVRAGAQLAIRAFLDVNGGGEAWRARMQARLDDVVRDAAELRRRRAQGE
jgi:hypothetical protein